MSEGGWKRLRSLGLSVAFWGRVGVGGWRQAMGPIDSVVPHEDVYKLCMCVYICVFVAQHTVVCTVNQRSPEVELGKPC